MDESIGSAATRIERIPGKQRERRSETGALCRVSGALGLAWLRPYYQAAAQLVAEVLEFTPEFAVVGAADGSVTLARTGQGVAALPWTVL